jgi:DNA-binding winged helix-turn-helix (wHTH) protein/TolB-like protein
MDSVVDRRPFKVGGATVDPVSRDARWTGGEERLQPQTLKVLLTLVSHRGEVVTRDDLIQLCWDGRIVGDDVINRSISLLRHFAERAGGFEIETVPRTGYRLVEADPLVRARHKRWWITAAAAAPLVVGGLAAWVWLNRAPDSQGVPPTPSISVTPFTTDTSDPLTRQVAQAAPIALEHVMSGSGFAVVRANAAGEQPGRSDYVLSGNVRRTASSVEATMQMVSRGDGSIAFAHDFSAPLDRSADLSDQIGATAAAELAWTGAEMALDPREHLNPEITSEVLQAMSLTIEGRDIQRAYQLSLHAASLSPNSAFTQLTLAVDTGFSLDSIPREQRAEAVAAGRRAGERARAMAPEFGDVYITWCLLHSPVRMTECDRRLRQALEVDSSTAFTPGYLSAILNNGGRIDESVQLAGVSIANDPYKPAKMARMIRMFEVAGRSDEAERLYQKAARVWPNDGRFRASRLFGMAERGNYAGLAAFAHPSGNAPVLDAASVAVVKAEREHDVAQARRACAGNDLTSLASNLCMTILVELGDRDRSFAIAAMVYPAWHPAAGANEDRTWLDHPSSFDTAAIMGPAAQAMRADPRFLDIAQKLGLLNYWRTGRLPDFCTKAHEPVCARISSEGARKPG